MPTTSNFGWTTPADTDLVKDGAAAIRTLGNGIDTSFLDLKGGTTGQVLSKASNTDLDFSWVAVDPLTILDAKADLITATAADTPARLAVGSNGQVLTADSTTSTGLKWATPSATKSFSLLNTGGTSLSGSTTTISGISSQDQLFILVKAASLSAQGRVQVRFNSDAGSNYNWFGSRKEVLSATGNPSTASDSNATDTIFESLFLFAAATTGSFGMFVTGAATSGVKMVQQVAATSASAGAEAYDIQGYWNNSSAITSVNIRASAGTFDAGTVFVYGAS